MRKTTVRNAKFLAVGALAPLGLVLAGGLASAGASAHDGSAPVFTVHEILSGTTLSHSFTPAGASAPSSAALTNPDDVTQLGGDIFVGFQNGVGPQGQASSSGNLDSTIVELQPNGDPVAQWDVQGKVDGLGADPGTGQVIATVNEDATSSLYTIDPSASPSPQIAHYSYNEPLPHNGGTDAVSIYRGQLLVSASAPGTTGAAAPQASYPAVYAVSLDSSTLVATVTPLFADEDSATVANVNSSTYGQFTALALTDPDSNAIVPQDSRFGGDFMLTSQGDQEQIYVHDAGGSHQSLSVLSLSQAVDDTAWPTQDRGRLYSTDSTNDSVDTVTGPFSPGQPLVVATPCGSNSAPATCPAPSYPANYLATLNPMTGQVTSVTVEGAAYTPEGGLLFVARGSGSEQSRHGGGRH